MFRKAIVVEVHHEDYSVDVVMCDDGARMTGVPVLSPTASTRTGLVDLPEVPKKANKWDITTRTGQEMEALVGFMSGGNPFVAGFLVPQVSQMTFDGKRSIHRHRSDFYSTITEEGDFEMHHPSGAYIRIAANAEHEDLEQKNFDKNFKLDRNKQRSPSVRLGNGDYFINLASGGEITVRCTAMNIDAGGTLTSIYSGGVWTARDVVAAMDVKAGAVSLRKHSHTGVTAGEDESGPPVGGNKDGSTIFIPGSSDKGVLRVRQVLEGPNGERLVEYSNGEVIPTDQHRNLLRYEENPANRLEKYTYVRELLTPLDSDSPTWGAKLYTQPNGTPLASLVYQPNDIVDLPDGSWRLADPITIVQEIPPEGTDPFPDNYAKFG